MSSKCPETLNLNDSDADMCSDVAGPSSSCSGDLFDLSDMSNKTYPELLNRAPHYWLPSCI